MATSCSARRVANFCSEIFEEVAQAIKGEIMIAVFDGREPRIDPSVYVHPSAQIIGDVEIGEGSMVWPGAIIKGDMGTIKIGKYVIIEENCVLHAGSPLDLQRGIRSVLYIGENVTIGHGAVVHARMIGNNVLIGMASCICEDVEIEDHCVIAAGTVIRAAYKIPERSFVAGVPGEIKGKVSEDQQVWIRNRDKEVIHEIIRQWQQMKVIG